MIILQPPFVQIESTRSEHFTREPPFVVYVIIPVHNNWSYTQECLEQLRKQDFPQLHLIVVDDGSTDSTKEILSTEYPEVDRLQGDGNLWWAGAVQLGVDYALARCEPTDHLLLLNNDTRFPNDLVGRLLGSSEAVGQGIVAAACASNEKGERIDVGGAYDWPNCRRLTTMDLMAEKGVSSGLMELEFLMSRAVLYPADCFSALGGFEPESLPHYHADMAFTHRAREAGYRLVVDLDTEVTVYETPSTSGIQFGAEPISFYRAFQILTSKKSSFQPQYWARAVDICCPEPYRFANKWSFFCAALANSVGRTNWGRLLLQGYREFVRHLR